MILKTQKELGEYCQKLSQKPYITVDTEFLRDKTYYSRLCLIQLCAPDIEAVALDPIQTDLDWAPFIALLDNPDIMKVFHAARQDLEIFHDLYGRLPTPIFDTQVAAMVLGYGDQISYANLVQQICGKELAKNAQFTDWSRRPLSEKQMTYALDDVIFLRKVYEKLDAQLEKKNRRHWVMEEMAVLTSPATYRNHPEEAWKRIKIRTPRPDSLAVLRELAEWREIESQKRDIPRGRLVKDDALADIAVYKPKDIDGLLHIRSLPKDVAQGKLGPVLIKLVDKALKSDKKSWPVIERGEAFPKNSVSTLEMLKMLLRINAGEADVAAKLIANADDMEKLATEDKPDIAALHGWRFDVFGKDALDMKAGKIALLLEKGKIVKKSI